MSKALERCEEDRTYRIDLQAGRDVPNAYTIVTTHHRAKNALLHHSFYYIIRLS
jgi:hypothetical protein